MHGVYENIRLGIYELIDKDGKNIAETQVQGTIYTSKIVIKKNRLNTNIRQITSL